MNKKTLVVALSILLAGLAVAGTVFIAKGGLAKITAEKSGNQRLVKDGFSVIPPAGWKEAAAPAGASLMVVNTKETARDPAAEKLGFRSYFSAGRENLNGKSRNDFLQSIRDTLKQSFPDIAYDRDEPVTLASGDGQAMEFGLTQSGVPFKVMLVMLWTADGGVWIMSFNTTLDKWNEYRPSFYRVAESFRPE